MIDENISNLKKPMRPQRDYDLVFCIDSSNSMVSLLEDVKKMALRLPDDILRNEERSGRTVSSMRIRVILFRNYLTDGQYAIQVTDFFDYPAEKEDLCELMNSITVSGNADESEDGLEALAYAMQSDWQAPRLGAKRRQIIVLWTDSSSHELGHGRISPFYDPSLPKDLEELTDWWGDDQTETSKMDYSSKRLLLFAPKVKPWTLLESSWDNVIMYPSVAGQGMQETDYQKIARLISLNI